MTTSHAHYEILATLAAAGQLSAAELAKLNDHTDDCPVCAKSLRELSALNREIFLLGAAQAHPLLPSHGMTERFTRRAIRAGIPITQPVRKPFKVLQCATATILFVLSLALNRHPTRAIDDRIPEAHKIAFVKPHESFTRTIARLPKGPIHKAQAAQRPLFTLRTPAFPQHDYANLGPHTLLPQSSELAGRYVTAGLDLPDELTLSKPPLPSFRAITQLLATGQHPSPNVASLTFTDAPLVFHFNPR